jgi:hypothetical protein
MGVWDQGNSLFDNERRHELIALTERTDFCFFWPLTPGMFLPAAQVLQERAAARKEADRALSLTRKGLYIAAAALCTSAFLTLLDILLR